MRREMSVRVIAAVAWLAAAVSPAHADDDELDIPGLDAPDLRGDALAWEDASFYIEPWEGGLNIRFSTFGRGRREEVGRAIPVRIVGSSMRTFVEVELPQVVDCAIRRVGVDPRVEALRLYVKRDDLAPVLVKPYSAAFGDGTSVRLAAGVPVMPTPSGLYAISVRGDRLRLPIPHGSVGYLYTRGKVVEPEKPTGALVRIDRSSAVKLGGEPFEVRAPWLAPKPAKPGDTALVAWSTRCIDLTVAVPTSSLRPAAWTAPYRPYEAPALVSKQTHHILRGTPLLTPAGREAAVAADIIDVPVPTKAVSCFEARLTMYRVEDPPQGSMPRGVNLCAAEAHVINSSGPPPASSSGAPTSAPADVARPPAGTARTTRGVWYRVLSPGRGTRKPLATESVKVHYTGWTTDGRMIDSSHSRGIPATFALKHVMPGWVDGLQQMTVGMKARLWIPQDLAYQGNPGRPAGMLVYDIELLEIQ